MGTSSIKAQRRLLRRAVQTRDTTKLTNLIRKGVDVNMFISDVFRDTPLTYAIKTGSYEIVDCLLQEAECDLNTANRDKHTPLDQAIRFWSATTTASTNITREEIQNRTEIIRLLLTSGAVDVTSSVLDDVINSLYVSPDGKHIISSLARIVSDDACVQVKSRLLSVLVPHTGSYVLVYMLLHSGARPEAYLSKQPAVPPFMPPTNAILLIQATNNKRLLARIECDVACDLKRMLAEWFIYEEVLRLLVLAGYRLQMYVMNFTRRYQKDFYRWYIRFCSQPKSLTHLCRLKIRSQLLTNVAFSLHNMENIPLTIKEFITLKKLYI